MAELVDLFVEFCISTLSSFGIFAGVLLILLESIIPVLPLSVFITLNLMTYGDILGYLVSLLSTILGCTISFFLFRRFFQDKLYRLIHRKDYDSIKKWMASVSNISFTNLVILLALPFTPAFLVNIGAGLSKMSYKKYALALIIGKAIMVYFWGYVGTSLLESLTDISVLLKIIGLLLLAYILSKVVERKVHVR